MGDLMNTRVWRGKALSLDCRWTIEHMQRVSNEVLLTRREHTYIARHWC